MIALSFSVVDAAPAPQTAAPAVNFRLRIDAPDAGVIHAIALRCQTRIEPRRRRYNAEEAAQLYELFGDPSQWDRTLQALTWGHAPVMVPSFEGQTEVDLTLPCTYDLEVASAKYLHAIRTGGIPLLFLFSGTVFRVVDAGDGRVSFSAEPIPWDLEATFRLPSAVWTNTMGRFFPGGGWLRLQRDTIDRLYAFRGRHAVVTWDEAIDLLLQQAAASGAPV
jgi:hypothetical protein